MGIDKGNARNLGRAGVTTVGTCVVCKRLIFSDQPWLQVRSPDTGKNHEWCVAENAVLAEADRP